MMFWNNLCLIVNSNFRAWCHLIQSITIQLYPTALFCSCFIAASTELTFCLTVHTVSAHKLYTVSKLNQTQLLKSATSSDCSAELHNYSLCWLKLKEYLGYNTSWQFSTFLKQEQEKGMTNVKASEGRHVLVKLHLPTHSVP